MRRFNTMYKSSVAIYISSGAESQLQSKATRLGENSERERERERERRGGGPAAVLSALFAAPGKIQRAQTNSQQRKPF
jgi:hypothetical protein